MIFACLLYSDHQLKLNTQGADSSDDLRKLTVGEQVVVLQQRLGDLEKRLVGSSHIRVHVEHSID